VAEGLKAVADERIERALAPIRERLDEIEQRLARLERAGE